MNFIPLTLADAKIEHNVLHLWTFSLADYLPQSETILNEEEKARANRFYFEKHQRRFATARTRVRELLGLYLEKVPQDLVFRYGKQGKPAVMNDNDLHFNVSHSGDQGIVAISNQPVGVDIERYSARPYTGIAEQLFSAEEKTALASIDNACKPALFFRIWAQKEAFIKANGLGLSYPLQTITVPFHGSKPVLLEDRLTTALWLSGHFMQDIAMSAAFCCHPDITHFYLGSLS